MNEKNTTDMLNALLTATDTLADIARKLSTLSTASAPAPRLNAEPFKRGTLKVRETVAAKARKNAKATADVKAVRLPSPKAQYEALQAEVLAGRLGFAGCPGFIAHKMREAMAAGLPFNPAYTTAVEGAYMYNRRFLSAR